MSYAHQCSGSKVVSGLLWALSWLFWLFFNGLAFLIEAPKVWPHFCQFGKILAEMGSKMFGGIFNHKPESLSISEI